MGKTSGVTRLVIIGAGPGGYVAALHAARRGAAVTVVESRDVGGVCLNRGCIPSKALLHQAELLHRIQTAEGWGIRITGSVEFLPDRAREKKQRIVSGLVGGIQSLFKSWGIETVRAVGSIADRGTVIATLPNDQTRTIPADRMIIATGSRPVIPAGFPFDGDRVMTSEEALDLVEVPKRLLIVGAGVEGCEFAFLYSGLGAEVTLVEAQPRPLPLEDEEVSAFLEREMRRRGMRLILGDRIEKMDRIGSEIRSALSAGGTLVTDRALISIGRRPNSRNLGLKAAGIGTDDRGRILVNDRMETEVPGIYAIGDVASPILLAHVASAEGRVAAVNAMGGEARMDYRVIPSGIFTQPEIGRVGLTERQAREQNLPVRIGRFPLKALGRAHTIGEISGFVKILVHAETDRILGGHLVGPTASDVVHELALAMQMNLTARRLAEMVHAHPTFPEALAEALEDASGQATHLPRKASHG
jgi:dihydrolipoamide dehydrogenase